MQQRWGWEWEDGRLVRLTCDGVIVLDQVAVVARDAAWGTAEAEVSADGPDAVRGVSRGDGVDVEWRLTATATPVADGEDLAVRLWLRARTECVTNRTGLVALHPMALAGRPVTVRHADGREDAAGFPDLVEPHQPFLGLGSLVHSGAPGVELTMTFAGDTFETEDQRNWSDASFKTYSRPLAEPMPYRLAAGEVVEQSITLAARGRPAGAERRVASDEPGAGPTLPPGRYPAPELGTALADAVDPDALARLRPAHLRAEVHADDADPFAQLDAVLAAGVEPLVALFLDGAHDEDVLAGLTRRLAAAGRWPRRLWVLSDTRPGGVTDVTEAAALERTLAAVAAWPVRPLVYVGTDHYLAELNRNRLDVEALGADGVVFSVNAQVHDPSSRAVLTTPETLPVMVATARSANRAPRVGVGPVTLRPRRNIYREPVARLDADTATDPRQGERFAAVWLLEVIAALAVAGVDVATVAELSGPRGLVADAGRLFAEAAAAGEVEVLDLDMADVVGVALPASRWLGNRGERAAAVTVGGRRVEVPPTGVVRLARDDQPDDQKER